MSSSKRISEFPLATSLLGAEDFIMEAGGITYKVSSAGIADYVTNFIDGAMVGIESLAGNEILRISDSGGDKYACSIAQISDYRRYGKLVNLGNVAGTASLDLSLYDVFVMTIVSDITISVENQPSNPPFQFMVRIKQGGAGNSKVTWPNVFRHPNDEEPVVSTTIGDIDIFIATCFETGRIEMSKTGPFKP